MGCARTLRDRQWRWSQPLSANNAAQHGMYARRQNVASALRAAAARGYTPTEESWTTDSDELDERLATRGTRLLVNKPGTGVSLALWRPQSIFLHQIAGSAMDFILHLI